MIRHPALPFFASLASRVAAVYNGIPPEGTPPLALGLYSTPEIQDPIQLEIEGEIPQWVTGSLYRGAQGAWDVGNYTSEHWFDGFSRNHRFEIADGKVTYRSRNGSDEVQDCKITLMKHYVEEGMLTLCSCSRHRLLSGWIICWRPMQSHFWRL